MKYFELWLFDPINASAKWRHIGNLTTLNLAVTIAVAWYHKGFAAIGRSGEFFQVYDQKGNRLQ